MNHSPSIPNICNLSIEYTLTVYHASTHFIMHSQEAMKHTTNITCRFKGGVVLLHVESASPAWWINNVE